MMILALGALLGLGIILLFVIANRNSGSPHRDDFYYPYEGTSSRDGYAASTGHHEAGGHNGGDWGARDMSHDHHDHGHPSDAGDTGGWGGDAGGGDAGGGSDGGGGGGQ